MQPKLRPYSASFLDPDLWQLEDERGERQHCMHAYRERGEPRGVEAHVLGDEETPHREVQQACEPQQLVHVP